MRKDCKKQLQDKSFLDTLEQPENIADLRTVHQAWTKAAGPKCGASRLGRHNWAQSKRVYFKRVSKQNQAGKVMETERQLVQLMEERKTQGLGRI